MKTRIYALASALAVTAGLSLSACAASSAADPPASAPGVTKDTITVGQIEAFSGAFAAAVDKSNEGLLVWFDYVNAHGGIYGRKVVVKDFDHHETAEGGVAACRQLLSDNDVFLPTEFEGMIAQITSSNCLNSAEVPNIVWQATDQYTSRWKYSYSLLPTPQQIGASTAEYVKSTMKPGDKIGFVELDQDTYQQVGESFLAEAKALGMPIADTETIQYSQSSYVPELQRLRAAGVTEVVFDTIGQETAMLKEAKQLGYAPKWTGSMFVFEYAPEGSPGLYNGVTGLKLTSAAPSSTYTNFLKIYAEYSHGQYPDPDSDSMLAYGFAQVVTKVLTEAGPNPTRQSLLAAFKKVDNYATGVLGPINWSRGIIGTTELWPVTCCSASNNWQPNGAPSSDFGF